MSQVRVDDSHLGRTPLLDSLATPTHTDTVQLTLTQANHSGVFSFLNFAF